MSIGLLEGLASFNAAPKVEANLIECKHCGVPKPAEDFAELRGKKRTTCKRCRQDALNKYRRDQRKVLQ